MTMSEKQKMSIFVKLLRLVHICVGLICLGIAGWFLFWVSPFNAVGFGIFLVVGIILLLIGLRGTKRDILETFFMSGV